MEQDKKGQETVAQIFDRLATSARHGLLAVASMECSRRADGAGVDKINFVTLVPVKTLEPDAEYRARILLRAPLQSFERKIVEVGSGPVGPVRPPRLDAKVRLLMPWFGKEKTRFIEISFQPLQDITAHELAQIMLRTQGVISLSRTPIDPEAWENLEPALKRHFREVP